MKSIISRRTIAQINFLSIINQKKCLNLKNKTYQHMKKTYPQT